MAGNVLRAGFPLVIHDLRSEPVAELVSMGATAASSGADLARRCDVIITVLPSKTEVDAAVLGPDGVAEGIRQGAVLIETSTIDPATVRHLAAMLSERGADTLDAALMKGVPAAQAGELTIPVGGDASVVERCRAVLESMASEIPHVGGIGAAKTVKIVNNYIVMTTFLTVSEALVLGVKAGLDPATLVEVLAKGSAGSFVMEHHVKGSVLPGKFPSGVFPADYAIKDLSLGLALGHELRVPLVFGAMAGQCYEIARATGKTDLYHSTITLLEQLTGTRVRAAPGQT
jgi:3-hydroxyisobutyrate dehydrogenase-like beta-hydroxyacid dehydrogenase